MGQYVPPKRLYLTTGPHGVTIQKANMEKIKRQFSFTIETAM
jgi:hypothetical protein